MLRCWNISNYFKLLNHFFLILSTLLCSAQLDVRSILSHILVVNQPWKILSVMEQRHNPKRITCIRIPFVWEIEPFTSESACDIGHCFSYSSSNEFSMSYKYSGWKTTSNLHIIMISHPLLKTIINLEVCWYLRG